MRRGSTAVALVVLLVGFLPAAAPGHHQTDHCRPSHPSDCPAPPPPAEPDTTITNLADVDTGQDYRDEDGSGAEFFWVYWSSSISPATMQWSLDGGAYIDSTTASPERIIVSVGAHVLRVRAVANGVADPTPAERAFELCPMAGCEEPPPPPVGECEGDLSRVGFTLAHCDDFNDGLIDRTVWETYGNDFTGGDCYPGHGANGLRCDRAVSESGGIVHIRATPSNQSISGKLESGAIHYRTDTALGRQLYGRYETRVRADLDPSGTMSAVIINWITDSAGGDWCDNESDFYETGTGPNVYSFFHYQVNENNGDCGQITSTSNHRQVRCIYYEADGVTQMRRSDWHDVAYEWTPSRLTVFADGRQVCNITDPLVLRSDAAFTVWQFDAFNCTEGLSGTNPPARTCARLTSPIEMQAEYARIYRYTP